MYGDVKKWTADSFEEAVREWLVEEGYEQNSADPYVYDNGDEFGPLRLDESGPEIIDDGDGRYWAWGCRDNVTSYCITDDCGFFMF